MGEKPYNLVKQGDFSLPNTTNFTIKQLFPGNNFIARESFEILVGKTIDWLNYASLKNVAMANMGPNYKVYLINNETNQNVHFRTTLRDLYLRETKGS